MRHLGWVDINSCNGRCYIWINNGTIKVPFEKVKIDKKFSPKDNDYVTYELNANGRLINTHLLKDETDEVSIKEIFGKNLRRIDIWNNPSLDKVIRSYFGLSTEKEIVEFIKILSKTDCKYITANRKQQLFSFIPITIREHLIELDTLNKQRRIKIQMAREAAQKEEEKKQAQIRKLEEEEARRRLLRKDQALERLNEYFKTNYIESMSFWQKELTEELTINDFRDASSNFIIKWFSEQNWFSKRGGISPDIEQAACIADVWNNVQVIARAGSGKTATIVNRTAFLVKHCDIQPSEIILLAFNSDAADVVNRRLQVLLQDQAPIAMTFHALAYRIVHPSENLIYDDEASGMTKSRTVQEIIDRLIRADKRKERISRLMLKYFRADWDNLTKIGFHLDAAEMLEFRRSQPYIGLDGVYYKSSGEKKIADYLFERDVKYKYEKNFWWDDTNYHPDFTIELKDKKIKAVIIEYFGLQGNSKYDNQINEKISFWNKQRDYLLIDLYPGQIDNIEGLNQNLGEQLSGIGVKLKKLSEIEIWERIKNRAIDEFTKTASSFISRCRKEMLNPLQIVKLLKEHPELTEIQTEFVNIVNEIYQEYLDQLPINKQEDFDGLMLRSIKTISLGEGIWKQKNLSGNLFCLKYLFIDEYQDFSKLFHELISSIQAKNSKIKVFCVGDDWQAINSFAGSKLCYFNGFETYYNDTSIYAITTNYRSCSRIVEFGNSVMEGEGVKAKPHKNSTGFIHLAFINEFKPDALEREQYAGDIITPMLIRLIKKYADENKRVAVLCRRKGLPWYTNYQSSQGDFHTQLIRTVKAALSDEQKSMISTIDTVHSFKGKEEDVVIVADALIRSYPIIHPRNVFFQILGTTMESIIAEEKRLFYVAVSRPRSSLVILTETDKETEFLNKARTIISSNDILKVNTLKKPTNSLGCYTIKVINNYTNEKGTFHIKSDLRAHHYCWIHDEKYWFKMIPANDQEDKAIINAILKESWLKDALGISLKIANQNGDDIFIKEY